MKLLLPFSCCFTSLTTLLLLLLCTAPAPARAFSFSSNDSQRRNTRTSPPPPSSVSHSAPTSRMVSLPGVAGLLLVASVFMTALPPASSAAPSGAVTKADFEVLVNKIDAKFDAIDNKFDAMNNRFNAIDTKFAEQQNMFFAVPIISTLIAGATTAYNTSQLNKIDKRLDSMKGEIKQDLKKDLKLDTFGSVIALLIIYMTVYGK